jgi:hypothetical protein
VFSCVCVCVCVYIYIFILALLVQLHTVDSLMNGLIGEMGGSIIPAVRYFRIMCLYSKRSPNCITVLCK